MSEPTAEKPIYHFPFRLANDCEHLGRIRDRLDCACPHKWHRDCDVAAGPLPEGRTNIDSCMTCSSYSPDLPEPETADSHGGAAESGPSES
jgi:hypothetical protein